VLKFRKKKKFGKKGIKLKKDLSVKFGRIHYKVKECSTDRDNMRDAGSVSIKGNQNNSVIRDKSHLAP
jgi:hypothetical protein